MTDRTKFLIAIAAAIPLAFLGLISGLIMMAAILFTALLTAVNFGRFAFAGIAIGVGAHMGADVRPGGCQLRRSGSALWRDTRRPDAAHHHFPGTCGRGSGRRRERNTAQPPRGRLELAASARVEQDDLSLRREA